MNAQSGSGDEPAPAQCPRAPHPPAAGPLPVCFMTADLRPSPDAQDVVSFSAMEGTEEEDDAISVAASAREEWSNSPLDYTVPHGSEAGDLHHSDVELLSVLSKAVDELCLEWVPPAELARSRLDEWYLQWHRGRKDTLWRPGPFFPEVYDEIKKSCTSRVHNPGSSLLSSVDGADQVGYVKLPPWKKPSLPISVLQPWQTGEWETTRLSPLNLAAPLQTSPARLSPRRAKQLQHCTWWRYSRCIRPSCSSLWMRTGRTLKCSKSSNVPRIWPSERRKWQLKRSAAIWGILWC